MQHIVQACRAIAQAVFICPDEVCGLALQVLEDASREFQGPEYALVTTSKADLALAKGDVDEALTLLQ